MSIAKRHGVAQILTPEGELFASCPIDEDEHGSLNLPLLETWFKANVETAAGRDVEERVRQVAARFEQPILSQTAKQLLAGLLYREEYEDVGGREAAWEELRALAPPELKPPLWEDGDEDAPDAYLYEPN